MAEASASAREKEESRSATWEARCLKQQQHQHSNKINGSCLFGRRCCDCMLLFIICVGNFRGFWLSAVCERLANSRILSIASIVILYICLYIFGASDFFSCAVKYSTEQKKNFSHAPQTPLPLTYALNIRFLFTASYVCAQFRFEWARCCWPQYGPGHYANGTIRSAVCVVGATTTGIWYAILTNFFSSVLLLFGCSPLHSEAFRDVPGETSAVICAHATLHC